MQIFVIVIGRWLICKLPLSQESNDLNSYCVPVERGEFQAQLRFSGNTATVQYRMT